MALRQHALLVIERLAQQRLGGPGLFHPQVHAPERDQGPRQVRVVLVEPAPPGRQRPLVQGEGPGDGAPVLEDPREAELAHGHVGMLFTQARAADGQGMAQQALGRIGFAPEPLERRQVHHGRGRLEVVVPEQVAP
jgi:hypothetical protein